MRSTPQGAARGALAGTFPSPALGLPLTIGQAFWDDFAWAGDTGGGGGGGAVDSVNGLTGVVVLDADAVGALEAADIGASVQAHYALLNAIGALSMVADRYIYGTGAGSVALGTITAFARTILDDADAATVRATLGAGTGNGDVTAGAVVADNAIVRGDGGAKGVQTSLVDINDSGGVVPRSGSAQQVGNAGLPWLEFWGLQLTMPEQASAQAPSGGWAGRSAFWGKNTSPTTPMFTDDAGTDAKLIRDTDIATPSAPGIAEVATYLEGQSAGALRVEDARGAHNLYRSGFYGWGIVTASPFDNNFEGSGCLSVTAGTGTFTGWMDATAGAYLRFPTSTATARGIYAGDGSGGLEWPFAGHLRYVFRFGGNSTFRIYGGLCSWGGTANMVAVESSTALCIRFGIDAGTIRAICGNGTNRTKVDFATSPGATTIYEWEIVPNRAMTSVTFNLYAYTSTGGRGALLETATITTHIPSTAVKAVPLVWTVATSGTPTAYWHSIETVGNSV
jgi:hypothetical protein